MLTAESQWFLKLLLTVILHKKHNLLHFHLPHILTETYRKQSETLKKIVIPHFRGKANV